MFCPTAATDGILPPFFPFSGLVYQLSDSFRGFFRLRSHRSNFGHETRSRLRKQRENAQDENRLTVIACPLSPDILDRTCPGRLSFSHVDRDLDPISSTAYFNFSFSLSLSLSLAVFFFFTFHTYIDAGTLLPDFPITTYRTNWAIGGNRSGDRQATSRRSRKRYGKDDDDEDASRHSFLLAFTQQRRERCSKDRILV